MANSVDSDQTTKNCEDPVQTSENDSVDNDQTAENDK